jgi:formylmethanofuran dehydrogenase subunit E
MMHWHRISPDVGREGLLALGVRFHGHLGPFMVAGIRMGILALRLLGHPGYRGIEAEVETGTATPLSCLIDGIQVATGCTTGKGNLVVRDGGRPRATFRANGKVLHIELKPGVEEKFHVAGQPEELAHRVLYLPEDELFTWELSQLR